MADEELVAELAEVACKATHGYDYISTKTLRLATEAVLARLAERGRLVPDGAKVEIWWNVRFTPPGSPPGFRKVTWDTASTDRDDAEYWLRDWADYQPELIRCEKRHYPDGSWLTTAWEAVAEETT